VFEPDQAFSCPYCGTENGLQVDAGGGRRQSFVTDCEVCCRPISIELEIESDGYIQLVAKREGEG
jgi:hypothetical protein